jgi:aspartokinase
MMTPKGLIVVKFGGSMLNGGPAIKRAAEAVKIGEEQSVRLMAAALR